MKGRAWGPRERVYHKEHFLQRHAKLEIAG